MTGNGSDCAWPCHCRVSSKCSDNVGGPVCTSRWRDLNVAEKENAKRSFNDLDGAGGMRCCDEVGCWRIVRKRSWHTGKRHSFLKHGVCEPEKHEARAKAEDQKKRDVKRSLARIDSIMAELQTWKTEVGRHAAEEGSVNEGETTNWKHTRVGKGS
eukprot:TRINITY_DN14123_c0_g1_i2.p2 TRINITY_DN14123_c0_g1~~TRINITY_DN14123_c0_g1_i2.p2  ORF type:complete len:156 (-),score=24.99 TRINITY_DN14123_c0_g1_i2:188-655(-)